MKTTAYTEKELVEVAELLAFRSGLKGQDLEDCQQEVALSMLIAESKADPSGNVKAYQYTTGRGVALNAFNKTLDHNRRFKTIFNNPIDNLDGESVEYGDTVPASDKGYVENTIDTERTQAIEKAIKGLCGREAEIVKAYLLNGETLQSIAKAYGFSHQRAHEILNAGKAKLAKELAEWELSVA